MTELKGVIISVVKVKTGASFFDLQRDPNTFINIWQCKNEDA